jgi:hypothetical protein
LMRHVQSRSIVLSGLLLWSAALPLQAQAPTSKATSARPEIVLPPVVLELAAPAAEEVQAGLPAVEQLLPPESSIPLPGIGELDVALPPPQLGELGLSLQLDPAATNQPARDLFASAFLSVGTLAELESTVAVVSGGGAPGFQLQFMHVGRDGVRGVLPVGGGGNYTLDQLTGSVRTGVGAMELSASGTVAVAQTGLQGQAGAGSDPAVDPFTDLASNAAELEVSLASGNLWPVAVTATLAAHSAAATLRGGTPLTLSEFHVRPELDATWQTDLLRLGLQASYALRSKNGSVGDESFNHVTHLGASASWQLQQIGIETQVAWRWGSIGHRVPFRLAVQATPTPGIAFSMEGGYRVQEHGLQAALDLPYVQPAVATDGSGWFAGAHVRLGLGNSLSLLFGASLLGDDAAPAPTIAPVTPAGGVPLYQLDQGSLVRITPDFRLTFTTNALQFGLTSQFELWEVATYQPQVTIEAQFGMRNPSRSLGMDLTAGYAWNPDLEAAAPGQVPVLSLDAFWQVVPSARVSIRTVDLLEPIAGQRLLRPAPSGGYLAPGLRGAVSLRLAF